MNSTIFVWTNKNYFSRIFLKSFIFFALIFPFALTFETIQSIINDWRLLNVVKIIIIYRSRNPWMNIYARLLALNWNQSFNFSWFFSFFTISFHCLASSSDVVTGSGNSSPTRGLISTVTLPPPLPISPFFKSTLSSPHQSMCFAETEHFLSVGGKDSTITLDLEPNRLGQMGACKRTFIAPEPHGFIVKLIRFKSKQMRNPNSHIDAKTGGVSVDVYNETATCPLIIVSRLFTFWSFQFFFLSRTRPIHLCARTSAQITKSILFLSLILVPPASKCSCH